MTIKAITPMTGTLAGSHLAGLLSDGQASQSAPITKPIRPHAAATNFPVLPVENHQAIKATTSMVTDSTRAIIRRPSEDAVSSRLEGLLLGISVTSAVVPQI